MVSISPLEGTLYVVLMLSFIMLGVCIGSLVLIEGVTRIIRKLGLTVYLGYADKPVTAATEPKKDSPQEPADPEPQYADDGESEGEPEDNGDGPQMPVGNCRGCRLPHAGLCPAVVEMRIDGMYVAPGTPFVCPRCWVGMNPGDRTNIARGGVGVVEPQPEKPVWKPGPDSTEPKPTVTVTAPDPPPFAEDMEAATAPDITCEKCGCRGKDNPRVVFKEARTPGGKTSGKFWCQTCIDQLGGPGERPKKKPRK